LGGVRGARAVAWNADGGSTPLGCLPFPMQDLLLPGESKTMHLFEARFLALFDKANKKHGGKLVQIMIGGSEVVAVGGALEVLDWKRLEVGVSVTVRCVGRVRLLEVTEVDPFPMAIVTEYADAPRTAQQDDVLKRLMEDMKAVHKECLELSERISSKGLQGDAEDLGDDKLMWGHESSSELQLSAFKQSLSARIDGILPREGGAGEAELLSFAGAGCFDATHRLKALYTQSCIDRMQETNSLLREHRSLLAAKVALRDALGNSDVV